MMRPGALHQTGTTNPDTVTSQPEISRSKCTTATMAKTTTAAAVNGFIVPPQGVRTVLYRVRLALCDANVRFGS